MTGEKLSLIRGTSADFFIGFSPQKAFVLLVLAGCISIAAWAGLTSVDIIVRTEGRIVPAGKSQIVQHLEGGIVRKILAHEGQIVSAGQPLMELSDVQSRSSLGQEQSKQAALSGRKARLQAEVNGQNAIAFPSGLNDSSVINAEVNAWKSRRAQHAEEIQVLKAQSIQKQNELAENTARRKNLQGELEIVQKQLRVIEGLRKNNAASELEVLEIQARMQRLTSQITETVSADPRLRAAQAEMESRINELSARFRAEASSTLTQVREELEKANHEIDSNVDRFDRNIVRAPLSGFINKMNITTIGGVVRPSEVLMEITPSDQRILIETRANPNDRANLRHGLRAQVRIGAYDYATFGTLQGRVTEVSADTISDEKGNRFYRVSVEINAETLSKRIRQPGALVPGMAASADIVVGKRTVLSYFLSPLLKFRDGAFRAETTMGRTFAGCFRTMISAMTIERERS